MQTPSCMPDDVGVERVLNIEKEKIEEVLTSLALCNLPSRLTISGHEVSGGLVTDSLFVPGLATITARATLT